MIAPDAKYTLQLLPTIKVDTFNISRISKEGNYPPLNKLFAWKDTVYFKKLTPVGLFDEPILYPIKYGKANEQHLLLLETADFVYPYGTVNIPGSNDCIVFRISEELIIEFFIFERAASMTSLLLTMLVDGPLSNEHY